MKYIAPFVFSLIIFLFISTNVLMVGFDINTVLSIVLSIIVVLILFLVFSYIFIQRVLEMKEEEKDDISKY